MTRSTIASTFVALFLVSCGGSDAHLAVSFAPGFSAPRHTVSVFGVYKDGRVSADSWGSVAEPISRSLGGSSCEAGYSESFVTANRELAVAIDDYARANGPTDDLMAALAPAAEGDLMLVLTVAGHPPAIVRRSLAAESKDADAQRSGPASRHGRPARDPDRFDVTATLYSVAQGRSVGAVALEYAGQDVDAALRRFAAKLAEALPGARCVGWSWDRKIDRAVLPGVAAE